MRYINLLTYLLTYFKQTDMLIAILCTPVGGRSNNGSGFQSELESERRTAYPGDALGVRLDLTQQLHRVPELGHGLPGAVEARRAGVGGVRLDSAGGAGRLLEDDRRSSSLLLVAELAQAPEHLRVGRQVVELLPAVLEQPDARLHVHLLAGAAVLAFLGATRAAATVLTRRRQTARRALDFQ